MNSFSLNQKGFGIAGVIIVVFVVGIAGFAAWKVIQSDNSSKNSSNNTPANATELSENKNPKEYVEWSFNGEIWAPSKEAPACPDNLMLETPIDLAKADSKLFPGQIRGGDYKPHGGLGINFDKYNNQADVLLMADAYLYRASRYIEAGEVQYLFDFIDSCGIMYRYDHLLTLSPEFKKYAEALPEPKPDDSKTEKFKEPSLIKAGTVIATEVGFRNTKNAGFDIGVYDLRKPNEASKTKLFTEDSQRLRDKEQSYFAICWYNLLQPDQKKIVSKLPLRNPAENTSDFCTI